ncbi:MAG: hypothetical protein A2Z75_08380 [Chloroflexi bacterium RBG_13_50_10]|nr:MAG: hypothetical protein A2Z75_08380 [Chloroflexi bacterium RBG_13_50_10]
MSEKRYTQNELDAMVAEIGEGLSDEQVAERRATIEKEHGLAPGALSKSKVSTGEEVERQKIYPEHYEATMEEVEKMTPDQYAVWSKLGGHMKKSPEEVQRDEEAEERDRAQAEENELIDKMSMPEFVAYKEQKALKAKQEKEAAVRLIQEEQKKKFENLRYKNPEEMTMEEYAHYREGI